MSEWGAEIAWTGGDVMPIYVRPNDWVLVNGSTVIADVLSWATVNSFALLSDHVFYYGNPTPNPEPEWGAWVKWGLDATPDSVCHDQDIEIVISGGTTIKEQVRRYAWKHITKFRLRPDHKFYDYECYTTSITPTILHTDKRITAMKVTIEHEGATLTLDQDGNATTGESVHMFVGALLAQTCGAQSIADALREAAHALEA